ncbi:GNAT family N-acetyltransferase [Bacillus sp. 31A1R]|uniref:GNAT family N-acetyltransferase n=1 Tax=Robertmurraya mangrovi TaxID=3098077 RepID=A0ABU5IW00_9BACI|nr:GNAT family N-acetyltransferase [Bacillus sp. 31A1R]MDZ5471315.1 GNAT family N-acetyltransferase [Bacillus sp. 31A1R]
MITLEKATIADIELLTDIMKRAFDEEARKWLPNEEIVDYNIQPPGYDSVEMTRYSVEELNFYKVMVEEKIVGGVIVTLSGQSYGRVDRIFIDVHYQGRGIGSKVIELIEEEFPTVRIWDLETSPRQKSNLHFYEKMGYNRVFETEDEVCFVKRKASRANDRVVENQDLANYQYENSNMAGAEFYQMNLAGSSFSNSNVSNAHFSNVNLSHSRFRNINLRETLFADLNLSNSKMKLVTLGGLKFSDTNLGEDQNPVSFDRCDLEGSMFRNCNLNHVEIQGCEISGMKIEDISVEELLKAYHSVKK